jgi:hypothetical protein
LEILGFLRYIASRHPRKSVAIHAHPMLGAEKKRGKLTAVAFKAALMHPGPYHDGEGLFLKADKRGGASWYLRVQRPDCSRPSATA